MAKTLTFTFEGTDYTLEFTRRTVREMEKEGFVIKSVEDKPVTALPQFFAGAFKVHHKFVKPEVIEKIYASMGNKEDLFGKLSEMYADTLETLFQEPDNEKKVEWRTNF